MSSPFRDSRAAKRRIIDYQAWLLLDPGRQPVECLIRDMSDTGARLAINFQIKTLPHRFALYLDQSGKVQRKCETIWSKPGYVGVRFLRPGAANDASAW